MTFDRLTDALLLAIELHRPFDLETGRVCSILRDANENHPLLARRNAVIDDLGTSERRMSVESLLRRGCRVGDRPVVYRGVRDHSNDRVGDPCPENDVLVVGMGLHFLFGVHVEDLDCSPSYKEWFKHNV